MMKRRTYYRMMSEFFNRCETNQNNFEIWMETSEHFLNYGNADIALESVNKAKEYFVAMKQDFDTTKFHCEQNGYPMCITRDFLDPMEHEMGDIMFAIEQKGE